MNDAVSLSILRIALAAWVGSGFSVGDGILRIIAILVGEPLYGWLLGIAVARLRSRITDSRIEITISLLTPFAAYLVPERLGGSGILATVAVGMYISERSSTLIPSGTRLHATSVWQMIVFLLNGVLFITAGMELHGVFSAASPRFVSGLWIAASAAAIRVAYCGLFWRVFRRIGASRHLAVIAWSGMRGPISLAAVLSIPASVGNRGLQHFDAMLTITAVVIVTTLLGQGASLPAIVKLLGVSKDAADDQDLLRNQQVLGQKEAAAAALQRLSELESHGGVAPDMARRLRHLYEDRRDEASGPPENSHDGSLRAIHSELIGAERSRILALRAAGRISNHALERLQRTLGLRETSLD